MQQSTIFNKVPLNIFTIFSTYNNSISYVNLSEQLEKFNINLFSQDYNDKTNTLVILDKKEVIDFLEHDKQIESLQIANELHHELGNRINVIVLTKDSKTKHLVELESVIEAVKDVCQFCPSVAVIDTKLTSLEDSAEVISNMLKSVNQSERICIGNVVFFRDTMDEGGFYYTTF